MTTAVTHKKFYWVLLGHRTMRGKSSEHEIVQRLMSQGPSSRRRRVKGILKRQGGWGGDLPVWVREL